MMSAPARVHDVLKEILLGPDPALPQRDILLDQAAMLTRLTSLLGKGPIPIRSCVRRRAKYQAGQSLRVLYEVRVNGESYLITARAYPPDSPRYLSHTNGPHISDRLRAHFHEPSLNTSFWIFPNDRKIRHLDLLKSKASAPVKGKALGWVTSRVVAYTPEKSATAECLDLNEKVVAYAKIYADNDEARRVYEIYRGFAEAVKTRASPLQIAKAVTFLESHNLLLLEAVAGEKIWNLAGRERAEAMHHLGSALAAVHNLEIGFALPPFKRIAPERLIKAAGIISLVRPDVAEAAHDLARRLCSDAPTPQTLSCLHADVHPKNGIAQDSHVTLIDFDQAAIGCSAADIGSMLAAIRYDEITGAITRNVSAQLADQFLAGYRKAALLPRKSLLQWHIAAACLMERALRAVNCIRPEGLLHLRELLEDATSLLSNGNQIFAVSSSFERGAMGEG